MKNLLIIIFASLTVNLQAQSYRIAPWYLDKKACLTITFDDQYSLQYMGYRPSLQRNNLPATFFVEVQFIGNAGRLTWQQLKALSDDGHEIGSQGFYGSSTNPQLLRNLLTVNTTTSTVTDSSLVELDLKRSKDSIEKYIGKPCLTLAYPSGHGGSVSNFRDRTIRSIAKQLYVGARSAGATPNGYDEYNRDTVSFYIDYGISSYFYNVGAYNFATNFTNNALMVILQNTIRDGGWFVPLIHNYQDSSSFAHMTDTINAYKNEMWITTFAEAVKYRRERSSAVLHTISQNPDSIVLTLADNLSADSTFNTPLTILYQIPPSFELDSVFNKNLPISFSLKQDSIMLNMIPDKDTVVLKRKRTQAVLSTFDGTKNQQEAIVYPNPTTNNQITIEIFEPSHIRIYATDGTIRAYLYEDAGKVMIENLSEGIYYVELITTSSRKTKKIWVK